ncbi:MAG: hypothetical protein GW938_03090 [Leptospira sp.]|nr:hypothetical protein [Leptospira sp.]
MIWFLAQYDSPYSPEYIKRIEDKAENFETLFFFLMLVCIFLFLYIVYQFIRIRRLSANLPVDTRYKTEVESKPERKTKRAPAKDPEPIKPEAFVAQPNIVPSNMPKQSDIPDPGLIFKYVLKADSPEKTISIGQREGTIKTYSTEIVDHHLTIMIRQLDNSRNRDIYELPDKIEEEYIVDFRRGGKLLFLLPGESKIQEMGARMRIHIKSKPDPTGDISLAGIDVQKPIRFRLGDRLTQDGKFRGGFFEFHFFTKDVEASTQSGIPVIEKQFFLKLYKIYPGYDTASQNGEGLFPMIDPFAKK